MRRESVEGRFLYPLGNVQLHVEAILGQRDNNSIFLPFNYNWLCDLNRRGISERIPLTIYAP